MDSGDNPSTMMCKFCGEAFSLPEDDVDGNLPRVLLCAHIYCTSCLLSILHHGVIRCPECEVESTLPEGVLGLQEDSRIIGLIYTSKINKMKRSDRSKNRLKHKLSPSTDVKDAEDPAQPADVEKIKKLVDEALERAAESHAVLDNIHETLTNGLTEQLRRERERLELEIKQAADKAAHAVQKWKDVQLSQLTNLEAEFSSSQSEASCVQKRMKALEIAMQMAREVRRVPFLEQYCTLDKVVQTLQAPVDKRSYDMKCIAVGSGRSCVFRSECVNQSLELSLKMEDGVPKQLSESPPKDHQQSDCSNKPPWQSAKDGNRHCVSPKPDQESPGAVGSDRSDPGTPDVILEELLIEGQEKAPPPTGPELANDNWRIQRRRRMNPSFGNKRNVTQWVVVIHVVNPSHFYVRYVAEKRESEVISTKINHFCCSDSCRFTSCDTVDTGSMVFVKGKEGLWFRARLVEVFQDGCVEAVKICPATQLASVRVFFLDSGLGKSLVIQREEATAESSLKAVNDHLRKVGEGVKVELSYFAPQAVRCSLKDLVPYDLTKGWSKEAQLEFLSVVGSAAVEMRPLGHDRDSLLVDLRKAPMDQSSDVPISVREYLVFIEVARFYSPVKLSRRPLLYYPPKYPTINTELNAVVSHINNPADFYIQLVDNMEFVLLSAKLQDCYGATTATEEDDLNIYCPVVEQACVARYEDTLWYRAQVIGHPGGRKVEVQYVDFGNKKVVSVSDLRKIKDEFFALPSRAIRCCLSDVIPPDGKRWSDACSHRFISLAHQKLVTVVATGQVPKCEPLLVKLFESPLNGPLVDIAELLVREQLASFKEGRDVNDTRVQQLESSSHAGEESAIWDPPLELGLAEEPLEFHPQLKLPDQLKDLQVRVSHVNSPSSFYVQLTRHDAQLKRVCELVKEEVELTEPEYVEWKEDEFCAALINGVWERGRICSHVTPADSAEVMRCDHGNKVKLHVSNLRTLPLSLTGSLALECSLTDIRPAGGRSTWTATACDLISFYLTGASAVMTIKELTDERPVPVTLLCSNKMGQFVSIADFLTSEGLALRERNPRDAATQKPKEADAQSPVKTGSYAPPELPCLGHIQISVSAIREDGLIYTRTQNQELQLQRLRERIQQSMKTLPRQKPYTWKSVQGCAVIGPDMLWYRGTLLEVLGGHVKVQYVDYGLVENIPVVHVYPMLLCDDVPQLCMPCQLHSINPSVVISSVSPEVGGRWQRDAVALLREMLLNRCVDVEVTELPSDPMGPVTVKLFLDGLNLNRILCHHQHASMDQTVSAQKGHSEMSPALLLDDWDIDIKDLRGPEEPMLGPFIYPDLPREGEKFQVRVKHLWTPNVLFLWPLEGTADVEVDGETLDEALTRINTNIRALQRLSNFRHGGPCLAEYSDGKFYRARMIRFCSVEPVEVLVQHVDFGSDDTLPTRKLRQMPAALLRFPTRALKVRVAGFKAPNVSGQEDVLPYSPRWSVKAALEMIDMLHGNITASVVAREPELTVLLYDEDEELVHLPLVSSGLAEFE